MKAVFAMFLSAIMLSSSLVEERKNTFMLIIFEGSDWCSNCRKFEKNILQDSSVINFLQKEKINIIKIDFPQKKKLSKEQELLNRQYAERYHFEGIFPTIILSHTDTLIYEKLPSSDIGPPTFIEQVKKIQRNI